VKNGVDIIRVNRCVFCSAAKHNRAREQKLASAAATAGAEVWSACGQHSYGLHLFDKSNNEWWLRWARDKTGRNEHHASSVTGKQIEDRPH